MGLSIGRAVLTEDLRNLKATGGSHPLSGLRNRLGGSIEGTDDLGQVQPTDMQIDGGGAPRRTRRERVERDPDPAGQFVVHAIHALSLFTAW